MTKKVFYAALSWMLFIGTAAAHSATTNSINQYGVTWTFDKSYEFGTFANGDYWVVGPVTITNIKPEFTGTRAGWEVNPTSDGSQGFDTNAGNFSAGLVPSLPYVASGGQSIVKQVPNQTPTTNSVTTSMAVLTVVSSKPPDNGASVFRPPYAGTDKSYYYLSNIKSDRLLSIPTTSSGMSYVDLEAWFKRPHIELGAGGSARLLRTPVPNEYGPAVAGAVNAAIAKLNGTDSLQTKWQALIWVIQAGIDRYHCAVTGQTWPSGTGHEPGHKLSVAFAAYMLDDQGMKDEVSKTFWWENRWVRDALWGGAATELQYWSYMAIDPGYNLEYGDPYRYIDGGNNLKRQVNGYQIITAHNIKGAACWLLYYPSMQAWWSDSANFISYAERWVNHGLKASPDPCAPMHPDDIGKTPSSWKYYGVTYGPDGKGSCIKGSGRFNDGREGLSANDGQYKNAQLDEMWDLYASGNVPKPAEVPGPPQALKVVR